MNKEKEIVANYAYAEPLDRGSSRQSPQGMTEPTRKEIERLVQQYVKRLGA